MSNRMSLLAGASILVAAGSLWHSVHTNSRLRKLEQESQRQNSQLTREIQDLRVAATRTATAPSEQLPAPLRVRELSVEPLNQDIAEVSTRTDPVLEERNELVEEFMSLDPRTRSRFLDDLAAYASAGNRRAMQLILDSLHDADEAVREEAVEAIARMNDPSLFGELAAMIGDPDGDVREEVAQALATMPADQSGPVLAQMLADDNSEVIEEALESLGKLRYTNATPQILELARSDRLDLVARAGETLLDLGETAAAKETVDRLAVGLESTDSLDRVTTIRYLRRVGGPDAIASLQSIAESDPSLTVREAARNALERM